MARIRTVKPEFWTSEQVADCSPTARLLFIGLWNFCDDGGVHPASCKRVKMEVFPGDDCSVADVVEWIGELVTAGLIIEYSEGGDEYWRISGWKHQKIEKPYYRYPGSGPVEEQSPTIHPHGKPTVRQPVADHSPPEGKGRESKGEEIYTGDLPNVPTTNGTLISQAEEVLTFINDRFNRKYPSRSPNGNPTENTKLIIERLKEGHTVGTCKQVAVRMGREWEDNDHMQSYIGRPDTLFRKSKFESYVGLLVVDQ